MCSLQFPLSFPRRSRQPSTHVTRAHSFLDLISEAKPASLTLDLPFHDPSASFTYDTAVIGCGPSGLRLAERASARGLRVCCIDPSPLALWPNNYGAWVDELTPLGLDHCFDHTWPTASVLVDHHSAKILPRPYGRIGRTALKTALIAGCHDVRFHRACAWTVEQEEFRSIVHCSDGVDIKASLVVDAAGFGGRFVEPAAKGGRGYQIAHGILAEVDRHPFDLGQMVLMDWRCSHLDNEPRLRQANHQTPTFLYAMPFDSNLIFLEETSLVSRPVLDYKEVKKRMSARLRYLGIKVKRVIEDEKCVIPMGGPLPRMPQSVFGFGGAGGLVHPSTGYMVARALAAAEAVADEMTECLGSTRMIRGRAMQARVWGSLWPEEKLRAREYYCFGMETLLKLDLEGTRRFFDAFFDLQPHFWHGFLSSRLSIGELAELSVSLFGRASNRSRMDIVTKCPLPLARMVANLAIQCI